MSGERYITAGCIGVLVAALVLVTGATRAAQRENAWLFDQMRTDLGIIESLKQANETLQTRLEQQPTERIITVQEPCREDVGHETPIFSRDSVVLAGR